MDHYVGHGKVWCCNGLRGFAAGINGKHWHVTLMTLALWPEVFASVSRVVVASRCYPGRGLTVWSGTGTTIRIDVDMKTVVARRPLAKLWPDPDPFFGVRQLDRSDLLAYAVGIDRIDGHCCAGGISIARDADKNGGKHLHNVSLHRILPKIRMTRLPLTDSEPRKFIPL